MVNNQSVTAMNARNGQLKCVQCDAVFSHVSSLTRHGQIHSGAFRCVRDGCEKTFGERKQLSKHLNRHSSTNLKVRIVPFNIRIKVEVKDEQNDDFVGGGSSQQSVQDWKRVKKEEDEDELKVKIELMDEHDQTGDGDRDNGHTMKDCKKEEDDESYCGCDDCLAKTEQNVNVPIETSTISSTVECSNEDDEREDVRIDELDETVEDEEDEENEGEQGDGDGELLTSGQNDEDDEMDVNDGEIHQSEGESYDEEFTGNEQMDDGDTEVEEESGQNEGEIDVIEDKHVAKRCKRMVIQQEERELIATECTTTPTQPNFAQSIRHLQCPQCPKSFDRNSHLQTHVRVHTGERPFQCDRCDKSFNTKSNLTKHHLIHQNIKQFRCHECNKQFTQKQQLDAHLLIHSGVRPFECRHCEKSFTQLATRNTHEQAIHLHVKPYRCKQCGHTATRQSYVIRHIRMVHFGLPQKIKEKQTLNIIDERDPRKLIEKV